MDRLKFVRWAYTARNRTEITVRTGDEVEVIKPANQDGMCKVNLDGRIGFIPEKCFFPRKKVNFEHQARYSDELSVNEDDTIGLIETNVGGNKVWKIMKDDGKNVGNVPEHCFYRRFEAYFDHTKQNEEQISVKKGDHVGLAEEDNFDVYWTVYLDEKRGLVPAKCFEPPQEVHWEFMARNEKEISVKRGDTVTLVDHHRRSKGEISNLLVRVRLGDNIGCIPRKCFEVPAQVYWSNDAVNKDELSVKKGDLVGLVEITGDEPPEGSLRARLGNKVGLIPKKCFEIPAKVIRNYSSSKLTIKKGEEVRVLDATMYIGVRHGDKKGEVPFSYINTNVREILPLLDKDKEDDHSMLPPESKRRKVSEDDSKSWEKGRTNVDKKALCCPLGMDSKKDAMFYLQDVDKIGEIGLALGLSFDTLHLSKPENLCEGMIIAWLERKDQVGTPTWKSLGSVLQKKGFIEAAEKISKENTKLEMDKLTCLRWEVDGNRKKLRIISEACMEWSNIATLIGMTMEKNKAIEEEHKANKQRFEEVFRYWIKQGGNKEYPATWLGLRTVLIDVERSVLAGEIRDAIQFLKF